MTDSMIGLSILFLIVFVTAMVALTMVLVTVTPC